MSEIFGGPYIFLGFILLLLAVSIRIYNGLVSGKNRFKNAFSQIDVQLKRRYDLIPNLIEVAKTYLKYERETFMTSTLDREISQIQPEKPWSKQNKSTLVANSVAVVIPITLLAILFFMTDIPGPVLVVAFFFPVQLLTAGVTTVFDRGKRGLGDAILSVACVTAFGLVLALLGSVVFSVIARGINTLSFSFISQNNIYISPPGVLDALNQTVASGTYYDNTTVDLANVSNFGRLIDVDLQSQLLFRIVTRDPDTSNTLQPINVY